MRSRIVRIEKMNVSYTIKNGNDLKGVSKMFTFRIILTLFAGVMLLLLGMRNKQKALIIISLFPLFYGGLQLYFLLVG